MLRSIIQRCIQNNLGPEEFNAGLVHGQRMGWFTVKGLGVLRNV